MRRHFLIELIALLAGSLNDEGLRKVGRKGDDSFPWLCSNIFILVDTHSNIVFTRLRSKLQHHQWTEVLCKLFVPRSVVFKGHVFLQQPRRHPSHHTKCIRQSCCIQVRVVACSCSCSCFCFCFCSCFCFCFCSCSCSFN